MTPWFGKGAFMAGMIAMMVIRAPHGRRNRQLNIVESRKGGLDNALLALMSIAMLLLPLIFVITSLLSFADYSKLSLALPSVYQSRAGAKKPRRMPFHLYLTMHCLEGPTGAVGRAQRCRKADAILVL